MDDTISRQAVIEAMGERPFVRDEWVDEYELGRRNQYDADKLAIETVPSAEPEDAVMLDKETILQAGYKNREVEFRIGGRLFRVREVAQ